MNDCLSELRDTLNTNRRTVVSCLNEFRQASETRAQKYQLRKAIVDSARMTFCTVSVSGRSSFDQVWQKSPLVVIDEAAQVHEAESNIVFSRNTRCLVLAGDQMQLPATVLSHRCMKLHYGRSLFQRLISFGWDSQLLDTQYRMHPFIADWASKQFYIGGIANGTNVQHPDFTSEWHTNPSFFLRSPVCFVDVDGQESLEAGSSSTFNHQEVEVVKAVIKKYLKIFHRPVSIGVITPYAAQLQRLFAALAPLGSIKSGVIVIESQTTLEVRTVDGFQGQERDIIIFSCVRTGSTLGFLSDKRRLNVACTRAKHSLWVVGKRQALIASDQNFQSLLAHASNSGGAVNCEHFVSRQVLNAVKSNLATMNARINPNDLSRAIQVTMEKQAVQLAKRHPDITTIESVPSQVWQISFKRACMVSVQTLSPEMFELVVRFFVILSSGRRRKKHEDDVTEVETSSHGLVRVDRIKDYYVVWSVSLRAKVDEEDGKAVIYYQILEVWDFVNGSDLVKSKQNVASAINAFSDEYHKMCAMENITVDDGNKEIHVPRVFPKQYSKISWYRSHVTRKHPNNEASSTVIDKSYRIAVNQMSMLLRVDVKERELAFDMNSQETEIIHNPSSLFVLGRSGTGKTTVMLYKMFHRSNLSNGNEMEDLKQSMITANPRLVQAMKQYWEKLTTKKMVAQDSLVGKNVTDIVSFTRQGESTSESTGFPLFLTFRDFVRRLNLTLSMGFNDAFGRESPLLENTAHDEIFGALSLRQSSQDPFFAREVKFEEFDVQYFAHFNQAVTKKFDSFFVWNEIQAVIKGSMWAVLNRRSMSKEDYIALASKRSSHINFDERNLIYGVYQMYEKRKEQRNEFDLHDMCLFVYTRLYDSGYQGSMVHYLSVDEVSLINDIFLINRLKI